MLVRAFMTAACAFAAALFAVRASDACLTAFFRPVQIKDDAADDTHKNDDCNNCFHYTLLPAYCFDTLLSAYSAFNFLLV